MPRISESGASAGAITMLSTLWDNMETTCALGGYPAPRRMITKARADGVSIDIDMIAFSDSPLPASDAPALVSKHCTAVDNHTPWHLLWLLNVHSQRRKFIIQWTVKTLTGQVGDLPKSALPAGFALEIQNTRNAKSINYTGRQGQNPPLPATLSILAISHCEMVESHQQLDVTRVALERAKRERKESPNKNALDRTANQVEMVDSGSAS
ncbi:hypothetical protein DFJ58DRAFT_840239 [Suillus subalutaceus]|uniref:uncharacterized protein n=1 Tax=Suillus subalutaceus TaxID=48586 RepID=UPI001B877BC6|nr:uncharacterized protein DFJ58DRAFT_840239 [Suillus subalutaceus]KAG1859379.1 hypothetical protein DFJ58DRAFT_840239 [Suillus subalutaceus]